MAGFAMFAFTDILGIAPALAGIVFLAARGWDAVNDPLMGLLADRTRTRWGRFRPWLLWTPLPIGLLAALMFIRPALSGRALLTYGTLVYVLWGMVYTLNDIPMWALTTAMTRNPDERVQLITWGRAGAMVGLGVPTVALPALAGLLGGNGAGPAWGGAAVLLIAVSVPLMLWAFLGTRERVPASAAAAGLRPLARMIGRNRPLQIVLIGGLLNSLTFLAQSMVVYFVTHNLRSPRLMVWFGGLGILMLAAGVLLTPPLARRIGKRRAMIVTSLLRSVVGGALYVSGYTYLPLAILLYALLVGLMGPGIVLQTAMIADSVDYGERRTGIRSEGLTFSFQTFLAKANAALGGLIGGVLLARVGYEAGSVQSLRTLQGIWAILTIGPALSGILNAIPFLWYPEDSDPGRGDMAQMEKVD